MTKVNDQDSFVQLLLSWANDNLRCFEWRRNRTPYKVMVAEFLLKRTTSKAVAAVYGSFIAKYQDIDSLATADKNAIKTDMERLGLANQRSKGIVEAAKYVQKEYSGLLPPSREQLLKVPFVGDYSAGCILSFGLNVPAYIVDSNVQRVLSRVFKRRLTLNPTSNQIPKLAESLLPGKNHVRYNYALIDFGALVCSYRGCSNSECPLRSYCDTYSLLAGKAPMKKRIGKVRNSDTG